MLDRVWAPPWWRVAAYAVVGALLVAAAAVPAAGLSGSDHPGRLVVAVAGVLVLALAGRDTLGRPTLAADREGFTVAAGLAGRRRVPWPDVVAVLARTQNRRGLVHLRTLEIDLGDGGLVVLSRRQLAADPVKVADDLEELRLRADGLR